VQHIFDNANLVAIYAIYAISLNVLLGYAGQLSVAHAAFGAVGGYLAAYLATSHGWGLLPGLIVGTAAAGVVGLLASLPALYLDVRFLILLTLALSTAILAIVGAIPALGQQTGLTSIPIPSIFGNTLGLPSQFFVFALIVGLIVLVTCARVAHSPFGRVLRAIRDDDIATRGVGKNIVRSKVMVFGITAAFAGTAGVMLAFYETAIQPSSYDLTQSMEIIAMVVVGGAANLLGSILGATILVLLTPFLKDVVSLNPDTASLVQLVIYGVLIALFMLVLPQGLLREGWTPLRLASRLRKRGPPPRAEAPVDTAPPRKLPLIRGGADGFSGHAEASTVAQSNGNPILQARGLKKRFGGIQAADGLNLELRCGEVTGLVGPNGAGKTTVFNLLTRAVPPDEGSVVLDGTTINDWTTNRIAVSGMARSYQDVRIFARMSVLDNVMIAIPHQPGEWLTNVFLRPLRVVRFERQARKKAMEHLRFVGLEEKAEMSAAELPFGEQKLLALARLLATEAEVLLLDEPASGIDLEGVERMLELIAQLRSRNKAVCIVEHNLHVVERVADRVYFMEAGKITAEGTLQELMQQPHLAEAYFGGA
jgi:branched-chain amino acid transport system permease protein